LKLSLLFPTDNIPLVDPSLYISRFASKLGFGNKTGRVITDASRLVSRMKADWIEYGRRPAGICGACLLIAARMNHFQRSLKDIMYVVKMSPETIRRRLIEFASTASGNLTIGDFRSTWLEQSANPPAFSQNNTENTEKEIEMLENSTAKEIKEFYESRKELISLEVKKATEAFAEAADPEIDRFDPNLEELQKDSDMEDELDQFILTEEEVEAKTMVWTQENKTYLEEQENKRKARESEEQNEANKRARKPNRKAPIINTTDPAEATLQLLNHKNITNVNKPGIQGLFQIPKLPNIDQEAAPL
jgi:transcription factor IIIB subunit 2